VLEVEFWARMEGEGFVDEKQQSSVVVVVRRIVQWVIHGMDGREAFIKYILRQTTLADAVDADWDRLREVILDGDGEFLAFVRQGLTVPEDDW
jgi:hypothetical protein